VTRTGACGPNNLGGSTTLKATYHQNITYLHIAHYQFKIMLVLGTCSQLHELRTRQHKMLKVKALRPSKHYLP
jgi:hypothetical protein